MPAPKLLSLLLHLHAVLLFVPKPGGAVYNVLDYGARPDGTADSAAALVRAWADACSSRRPATVLVPAGTFLVSQAEFSGPCNNRAIKFSIGGALVAPPGYDDRRGSPGRWIMFANVEGVTVSGGTLDGRGASLWECKLARRECPTGASSLTFLNSRNITIDGLTSRNSELFHIVVMQCQGVTVRGVTIAAPENSPNTDGIHLHMSSHVAVYHASIATGDDCISVGPGNAHLWIEDVSCGPGHGISIGSLGKEQGVAVEGVDNVTVKTTTFAGTENGLRIKTWATPKRGYVRRVTFADAVMSDVRNPIIIDQDYCPGGNDCPRQSSGIKISEVKYIGIRGSSAKAAAVQFNCSASNPCRGISLQDIRLTYRNQAATAYCANAQGSASGPVVPPSCL